MAAATVLCGQQGESIHFRPYAVEGGRTEGKAPTLVEKLCKGLQKPQSVKSLEIAVFTVRKREAVRGLSGRVRVPRNASKAKRSTF